MPVASAIPKVPALTVIDGGRVDAPVPPPDLLEVENAWIEVQATAHEAHSFVSIVVDIARRIQVAVAAGRLGLAGQYAHDLEVAAPRYAHRARAAELEAQLAIARIHPEPVA